MFGTLSRQRKRIAGQIADLYQPRKQRIKNHDGLALTGGRERPIRAPTCVAARMLAAAARDPSCGRSRMGEESLVAQAVLVWREESGLHSITRDQSKSRSASFR